MGRRERLAPMLLWGLPPHRSLLSLLSGRLKMWSLPGAYAVSCEEVKLKVEFSSQVSWPSLSSSPEQPVLNAALGKRSVFLRLHIVGCFYLCVYICLCVCAHECGYAHEHGCAHECGCSRACRYARECEHTQRHLYLCECVSSCVCAYECWHTQRHLCLCLCIYLYVHRRMGVHTSVSVHRSKKGFWIPWSWSCSQL